MSTTVFDASAVADLTGDPRDAEFATAFVARFRELLPRRVDRIVAALDRDDPDETIDAVLSLKVSAATVGAGELRDLAARIEQHLRAGEPDLATAAGGQLAESAARADRAFAAYLA